MTIQQEIDSEALLNLKDTIKALKEEQEHHHEQLSKLSDDANQKDLHLKASSFGHLFLKIELSDDWVQFMFPKISFVANNIKHTDSILWCRRSEGDEGGQRLCGDGDGGQGW